MSDGHARRERGGQARRYAGHDACFDPQPLPQLEDLLASSSKDEGIADLEPHDSSRFHQALAAPVIDLLLRFFRTAW